jgi:L-threonylcarbamoyladenylate synthase
MNGRIGSDVEHAAALLRSGEVVAIPTETVYGLAANTFDEGAVLNIFTIKERPTFDPLIVHIAQRSDLHKVAQQVPASAEVLMDAFWPGPLTLVLPKRPEVPDLVTSGLDSVAVRMPAHPMMIELLGSLDFPLAAPSANPFGYISPTTAQHVADQLGEKVPYILDGGPCAVGVESTIIGWEPEGGGRWVLYRPGGITTEQIEVLVGPLGNSDKGPVPMAPGMMDSHYAPRKPVHVGDVSSTAETLRRSLRWCDQLSAPNTTRTAVKCFRWIGILRKPRAISSPCCASWTPAIVP